MVSHNGGVLLVNDKCGFCVMLMCIECKFSVVLGYVMLISG